jgi:hypothetical protein
MDLIRTGSFGILATAALLAPLAAHAYDLTVTVDPETITEGESIQLRIQTEVPLSTVVFDPEFEAKDFIRLGSSSQGMSVSYSSDASQAMKTVYYTYMLSPNKSGVLTIKNIRLRTNKGEITAFDKRVTVEKDNGQHTRRQPPQPQQRRGRGAQQNPGFDPNDPFAQFRNMPGFPPGFLDEDDLDAVFGGANPAAPPPGFGGGGQQQGALSNPAPQGAGRIGALNKYDHPEKLNSDFTVHAALSKRKVYVGEPVVVEYSLYDNGGLTSVEVQKWPTFNNFWKDDLEIATRFEFEEVYIQNQPARRAFLGRYAIYGIKPGKFNLDKMIIKGSYSERRGFFRGPERTGIHASQDETLEILPLPEAGRPANFSGAVGKFSLKLNSDKTTVAQNTPITLSLSISGAGNFQSIESVKIPLPADFELYDSSTGSRGVVPLGVRRELETSKTFTYTAIPRKAGKFTIDPVEWTYFDPEKGEYVTAKTDPISVNVEASAAGTAAGSNSYLNPGSGLLGSKAPTPTTMQPLRELTGKEKVGGSLNLLWRALLGALAILNIYLLYRFIEVKAGKRLGKYLEDPFEEAKNELQDAKNSKDGTWLGHLEAAVYAGVEVLLGTEPRGLPRAELESHWKDAGLPMMLFSRVDSALNRMDELRFSSGKSGDKARSEMQAEVSKILGEMAGVRKRN